MEVNQKIIIGGTENSSLKKLSQLLSNEGMQIIETNSNSLEILFEVMENKPAAVFFTSETSQPEKLIEKLLKINPKPLVNYIVQEDSFFQSGIKPDKNVTVLKEPLNADNVACSIIGHLGRKEADIKNAAEYLSRLHNYVSEILSRLCVTPNYNGFIYLREAIKMAVLELVNTRSFSKCVYPRISQKFQSSTASIERNIRTVIQKGWQRAPLSDKADIFGTCAARSEWHPTNGEFILIIADKVNREMNNLSKVAN